MIKFLGRKIKAVISFLVLFLTMLFFGSYSFAEVHETIDYLYYEVNSEKNKYTLDERLNTASPLLVNEKVQHSLTRWNVTWKTEVTIQPDTFCSVGEVKVKLHALIQLPELVGEENAPLQKKFNAYAVKLQAHEVGHYMLFAIQAANEIDVRLMNMEPAKSCKLLEEQVNEKAKSILKDYLNKENKFDTTTNFGRK